MLPDGGDFIAAFWGTLMAGLTAFPLNGSLTAHEMLPLLKHARVNIVITSAAYHPVMKEMVALEAMPMRIVFMDALTGNMGGNEFTVAIDAWEPMVLLNTSGTTGKCKIVQLSEKNVAASVLGYLEKCVLMKHIGLM